MSTSLHKDPPPPAVPAVAAASTATAAAAVSAAASPSANKANKADAGKTAMESGNVAITFKPDAFIFIPVQLIDAAFKLLPKKKRAADWSAFRTLREDCLNHRCTVEQFGGIVPLVCGEVKPAKDQKNEWGMNDSQKLLLMSSFMIKRQEMIIDLIKQAWKDRPLSGLIRTPITFAVQTNPKTFTIT